MQRTQVAAAEQAPTAAPGLEIRPACPADRDAIRSFLEGLSLRSRYLRFFTGASPASGAMLAILTGARGNADTLVATEAGRVIGHAMSAGTGDPTGARTADIGVVVADFRRGLGVGSALVRRLTARAQARGATMVTMEVLRENRDVLAMIAAHWPAARYDHAGEHLVIRACLPVRAPFPGRQPLPVPRWAAGEPVRFSR